MAIAYVAIGTRVDTATGTPTLAYPAGIASGDFLVACCHFRGASAGTIAGPVSALTWADTGSPAVYHKVFTATYDGLTSAPTIDTATKPTYARMFALRSSNAIVVDAIAQNGATQVNLTYPALTLANDNEFLFTYAFTNSAITSVAVDAGFTEIEDVNVTAAAGGVQIAYQIQTTRTNLPLGNPVVTGGSSLATHGISLAFTEIQSVAAARTLMLGVG